MRKPFCWLALIAILCTPLTLSAAGQPATGGSPFETTSCSIASPTVPPATPMTIFTYGVCARSCDPATCQKGPAGFCLAQQCILGQNPPVTCAPGDHCIARCDL